MAKEVIMPVLGMNQETGTLVEWFMQEGDEVTKGEPLMVVATDKTEVEIEATTSGVLANVSAQPGDEVPVGSPLALILAPGESAPENAASSAPPVQSKAEVKETFSPGQEPFSDSPPVVSLPASPVAARIAAEHNVDLSNVTAKGDRIQKDDVLAHIDARRQVGPSSNGRVLASPKARRLAKEIGLDLADISGSGPNGAILTDDVLIAETLITAPSPEPPAASHQPLSTSTIHPMSRAWKVMAQRLQESWQSVPHFYLERNVDATALMDWRERAQKRIEQKVTVTDCMTKVVAAALGQHPRVNASWIDKQIVLNSHVNVGLAVAVDEGLLVPVLHQANQLGLGALAERRSGVVNSALAGTLTLDDLQGGTFTISNLGMFGITKFNAIVNPPQAAILAVGGIEDQVVAIDGKPAVRPMMTLTLSCDHRVVDGARGAQFMQTLVEYLEDPLSILD
ncbi:MAG: dihydrolipoamide acetyltransferase family protein [Chloroflexota bacterium]